MEKMRQMLLQRRQRVNVDNAAKVMTSPPDTPKTPKVAQPASPLSPTAGAKPVSKKRKEMSSSSPFSIQRGEKAQKRSAADTTGAALSPPSSASKKNKQKLKQSGSKPVEQVLSPMQKAMKQKLQEAQFRWLNEQLYTQTSNEAEKMFREDPAQFDLYHKGFASQVSKWPTNPNDVMIHYLQRYPNLVVGDFGCGEAKIAASVPNEVHSFDLVAVNERVTACNVRHVPLQDGMLDVAVFCLALMGKDYMSFLVEANRCMKTGGWLKIAEVRSRFEHDDSGNGPPDSSAPSKSSSHKKPKRKQSLSQQQTPDTETPEQADGQSPGDGRDNPGIQSFVQEIETLGFQWQRTDTRNKMFVLFDFRKREDVSDELRAQYGGAAKKPKKKKASVSSKKPAEAGSSDAAAGRTISSREAHKQKHTSLHSKKERLKRKKRKLKEKSEKKRSQVQVEGDNNGGLKPCVYKRR